jgi:bifunctional non-homologous end joining protein LigD
MSLSEYKKKRSFSQTPEPKGKKIQGEGPLSFVIQKHQASRLHYDFRLEMDGVLKSWAVPRGPSLNPQDRRLAVHVEDHPIEYATFEGIIPKKNYGAGTVMVWDQGVYMPYIDEDTTGKSIESRRILSEKILLKQLEEGHITIVMLGEKLKGEFALVKAKNSDKQSFSTSEENAWFLIKKGDEYASNTKDILEEDKSVVSGRSLAEINKFDAYAIKAQSEKKKDIWYSQPKDLNLHDAPIHNLPDVIKPMLAESAEKAFDDNEFIFEMKWDGYRAIADVEAGKVKLYSRNNINYEEKFAPVFESLKKFPGNAVLDGEIVMLDRDGKPKFQWIQDYPASRKEGELVYYVFDLLSLNGHDLTNLPLIKRKELLKQVLPPLPHLAFSDHIETHGKAFFEQTKKLELEGIIAKKADSHYRIGVRSRDWLKIKSGQTVDAVIAGFTKPRGGRKFFGALVVGEKVKGKLRYIGHVGGGFTDKQLKSIYELLSPLFRNDCPFEQVPETNEPVTWIDPQLECEVSFSNWTSDRIMRHPLFVKLIEDGSSLREVGDNEAISNSMRSPRSARDDEDKDVRVFSTSGLDKEDLVELTVGKRKLEIVNPNKIFWPKEGYKKIELIEYYREIAPVILLYLINRPQSLLRFPHGAEGESFFQKDTSNLNVSWLHRLEIRSDSEHKKTEFMLCQDEASLIYMINLGCIDLNPWNSTVRKLENPDYLIIDLDPEGVGFKEVVKVALTVREFLEKMDIVSFPKTSGSRGMHIFVPMGAVYTHEQVRQFAELLCIHIQAEIPELSSIKRSPSLRQGKVYLDYLQNGKGKTLASVYSVRPKKGATVSAPLEWSEVNVTLDMEMFTMKNMMRRIEKKGDLFKGIFGKGVNIKKVLKKLETH